jgi:hypothetical protein
MELDSVSWNNIFNNNEFNPEKNQKKAWYSVLIKKIAVSASARATTETDVYFSFQLFFPICFPTSCYKDRRYGVFHQAYAKWL